MICWLYCLSRSIICCGKSIDSSCYYKLAGHECPSWKQYSRIQAENHPARIRHQVSLR